MIVCMATVKLKFRSSAVVGKEGVLYYRVVHNKIIRRIDTSYRIYPFEWNMTLSSILVTGDKMRRNYLRMINSYVAWEIRQMHLVIYRLEMRNVDYTTDVLISEFAKLKPCQSVFEFICSAIEKKKSHGHLKTCENYQTAFNRFREFRQNEDLCFDAFNAELLQMFELWLNTLGLRRNTTSSYMRCLRSIYSQAIEEGFAPEQNQKIFRYVYTGVDKTVKRAVSSVYIRKIKKLELSGSPSLEFARDMFMFSFYTRGMSFVDIAYLRKKDIKYGTLTYTRRKTGQKLSMHWEKEMQFIANCHLNQSTQYLFPIIVREDGSELKQYRNALRLVNKKLKKIAEMIDLKVPLTLYVARHSWASIAKANDIPLNIISEGMGHDSELTTRIYLNSLESSVIDKANRKIINLL